MTEQPLNETNISLPRVPEPFVVTTGYEVEIQQRIDSFFADVLHCTGYEDEAYHPFVHREVRNAAHDGPQLQPNLTDDRITWLVVRQLTAASVLERRNDFNYVEVLFASYLTPGRIENLRANLPRRHEVDR